MESDSLDTFFAERRQWLGVEAVQDQPGSWSVRIRIDGQYPRRADADRLALYFGVRLCELLPEGLAQDWLGPIGPPGEYVGVKSLRQAATVARRNLHRQDES